MADEPRRKLCIKTGPGTGFTGTENDLPWNRKLTIKVAGDNIHITPNGLYVPDLSGDPGPSGGSTVDNYSITDTAYVSSKPFPIISRSVCCYIFTLCAYKIASRTHTTITPSTTVKTMSDIISEYNGQLPRAYVPQQGELLQLMTTPAGAALSGGNMYEDFNRYATDIKGSNYKTLALFVINKVTYNYNNNIASMASIKLTCLYSSLPNFTKGTIYSSS